MWQNRTMLYAVCFTAWPASQHILNTSTSVKLVFFSLSDGQVSVERRGCSLKGWFTDVNRPIHRCRLTKVQMRFEKGSPIRGFSLGATAGTLAGSFVCTDPLGSPKSMLPSFCILGNMWCTKITAVLLEQCMSSKCSLLRFWQLTRSHAHETGIRYKRNIQGRACIMPSHFLNIFGAWLVIGQGDAWNHWVSWICLGGAIFFATSTLPSAVLKRFFFVFFFRFFSLLEGVLARMAFPVVLPGNLYYISRGMQQHEALFMVTASWIQWIDGLTFRLACHGETWWNMRCTWVPTSPPTAWTLHNVWDICVEHFQHWSDDSCDSQEYCRYEKTWKPHWIWQKSQFLKLPSRLWGLSAIVVLGEMDDAPWWKLAGYTCCILMMIAAAWDCGVRVEEVMWKKPCCLPWWSKVGMALLTSGEKVRKRDLYGICLDLLIVLHGNPLWFVRTWKLVMWRSVLVVFWQRPVSPSQNRPLQDDPLRRLSENTCEYLWFFLSYLWSRNQGPLQSSHNTSVQMRVIRLRKHHTPSLISRKFNIFVHNFQFLCPGDRCSEGIWRSNSMQGSDDSKIIDLIL